MKLLTIKNRTYSRRAVSEIIGTLIMMMIVLSIGTVVLFQGMTGVNDFNNIMTSFLTNSKDSSLESLTIEHVRFHQTSSQVSIYVRNTSTINLDVSTITIVRIDNHELIANKNNVDTQVFPKDYKKIDITAGIGSEGASLSCSIPGGTWSSNGEACKSFSYTISVTTKRGNSFTTVAQPYNT